MDPTKRDWRQFPTHLLPKGTLKEFIYGHSGAIRCDHTFIALPLFAMLGAAIGTRRCLQVKKGWREFPVIWAAIIGNSGTKKSPAAKSALEPLSRAENNQPPEVRYLVSDTTLEALVTVLETNPNGLLVYRDELSGWFSSFNQYKAGRGADLSSWLSMHQAGKITVDRKTPKPHTIRIPAAAVGVTGSIQPGILQRHLNQENFENGLAARFLYAMPPETVAMWNETEIDDQVADRMDTLVNRLLCLSDTDGPQNVTFDPDAKARWIEFYNATQTQKARTEEQLKSAFSKLEAYCARLALIFTLAKWADGMDCTPPAAIDEESMACAITIIEWFKLETRRVYSRLLESDSDRKQETALTLAEKNGGVITAWELKQQSREFSDTADAEAALKGLVRRGAGVIEVDRTNKKGRPATRFKVQFSPVSSLGK